MLFGYFLQYIAESTPAPVSREQIQPGSVVVAAADMQQLRETGLPCALRFGIATEAQEIICQCCETDAEAIPENLQFTVRKLSLDDFVQGDRRLYIFPYTGKREPEMILLSAKMRMDGTYRELRSYPGDDFVAECLTGLSAAELIEKAPMAGQHWWTPLQMTLREGLKWLGVDVPAGWLPQAADVQVFDQTHHGITIEANQVIHFSTRRVPDGSNRIKADSLREFRSIGDDELSGSPVKYKEETPGQRLRSRNRAVWVFCHAESWGGYNLMDNNCEHFSRYCRVGRKESRQVIAAFLGAVGTLISILPKTLPYRPLIIALGLLLRNGARVMGRPEAAKVDDDAPLMLE